MKAKGWKNIFSFTFLQKIKTKSFIISTVIISLVIALIAATANILPVVLLEDEINKIEGALEGSNDAFTIERLYIADETELNTSFAVTAVSFGLTAENIDPSQIEAKIDELAETTENAMLAHLTLTDGYMNIEAYYSGENSTIDEADCASVLSLLSTQLEMQYYTNLGMTTNQMSTAMGGVSTQLLMAGDVPDSMVEEIVKMIVPMISSLVLFMFIFIYSSMVAEAVAIEKSSRVMEYLLTAVSPLSIIIGKVLAICAVALMQFLIILSAGALGFIVSMPFGIFSKIDSLISAASDAQIGVDAQNVLADLQGAFSSVNIGTLLLLIITFILGFLLYALIAGLAGASVSKMEDLSAAVQPMSFIGVLGFYLAYMPLIGDTSGEGNIMQIIARYIPISSPFCMPSAYMLDQMSFGEVAISLAILLACVVGLCLLVAKVYEHIVLHTGDRLKIKDMLKMADNTKK